MGRSIATRSWLGLYPRAQPQGSSRVCLVLVASAVWELMTQERDVKKMKAVHVHEGHAPPPWPVEWRVANCARFHWAMRYVGMRVRRGRKVTIKSFSLLPSSFHSKGHRERVKYTNRGSTFL